jgi:putative DNA primase/helicase
VSTARRRRWERKLQAQVRAFIERHGASRFEPVWAEGAEPTHDRVGFRRLVGDGRDGLWWYYVLPESWKSEVCKGLDAGDVARLLVAAGHLDPGADGVLAQRVPVPGWGVTRVYVVKPSILEGEDRA